MRKKLFTLLLAIVASIGTIFAESGTCGPNLTWDLTDGVLTISGTGEMKDYSFYSNAPWYSSRSSITSVAIENGVTSIGKYAFYDCTNLTGVTISNSVANIGESAFSGCNSLPVIDNVRYADTYLVSITDNSLNAFTIKDGTRWIGSSAFERCRNLTTISIPNSVIDIGDAAFGGCGALTSITIPNSVTRIGASAFNGCSSIQSLVIPNNVEYIGEEAFGHCTNLSYIKLPDGYVIFEEGSDGPFNGCSSLPVVEGIRYADTYLIEPINKTLSTYAIKDGTKWIGHDAFYKCSNLSSIDIPQTVIHICEGAFYGCSSLSSVIIPNSVISIGSTAFSDCSSLTSVTIPNSVTSIEYCAFCDCSSLSSVTIPNSVENMGRSVFSKCTSLPIIDNIRYADTYLVEAVDKDLSTYSIKDGTKWIMGSAFKNCTNLTSISIPNTIISIGNEAFYNCGKLASIGLPENISLIDVSLFENCTNLTSITVPKKVKDIYNSAFRNCRQLSSIYSLAPTPPEIRSQTFENISNNAIVYVPPFCSQAYRTCEYWNNMNIQSYTGKIVPSSTSIEITFDFDMVASIGISGGEQQPGNVLEYIGLEPNSEYKDIPVVLTSNTGETETVNVSFTTPSLTLTTKASKPVSSTTAILLAETNMSDAEVSCGFEYKRNDAPDDMAGTKVFCPVASGQMAGRLKNLKDDVFYKYRAFYQSAAGNMYYGDWQYIFTGDNAVEFDPILYTYTASVITETGATLSGYALAGSEDFTEQGFEYWAESRVDVQGTKVAPHRMPAALNDHFFAQASGIKMTVTLTNLDEGTVYKYRAYGKVGNQYYYGSEQTFTTQGEWQEEQGIEDVQRDNVQSTKVQKILRNGQIYILNNGIMYNVQGQKVK